MAAALPGAELVLDIPPVPLTMTVAGQAVSIIVAGKISGAGGAGSQPLSLDLQADFTDLQSHMTPLLQVELNQSNRCGERISVEKATLVPAAPAGSMTVQLHFEKWVCIKAFGRENAKRLVGGDGSVQVLLTPVLGMDESQNQTVRLEAEVGRIDADGSLGEVLQSNYGTALRDKIREALLKAVQKSTNLETVLPEQARPFVTIQRVSFAEKGTGMLMLNVGGRIMVPPDKIASILGTFPQR
jgi:hypothetical protein